MRLSISCVSIFRSSWRGGKTILLEDVVPRGPPGGKAPLNPGALVLLTSWREEENRDYRRYYRVGSTMILIMVRLKFVQLNPDVFFTSPNNTSKITVGNL